MDECGKTLITLLPAYWPPVASVQAMARADLILLADTLQYTRTANVNRARIKNINGPLWLSVPVLSRNRCGQPLLEVRIDNHENWARRHLRSLEANYRNAPYFYRYIDALRDLYAHRWDRLIDHNLTLLNLVQRECLIRGTMRRLSEAADRGAFTEQVIAAMRAEGCRTYRVEERYRPYLDTAPFELAGLCVEFYAPEPVKYYQQFGAFIPDLSIIDLLFNEGEMSRLRLDAVR